MEERVRRLRDQLYEDNDRAVFYERMTLLLEGEKKYRSLDNGKKYAACFAHLLKNMTVEIKEDELIVGTAREIVMSSEQEEIFKKNTRRYNFRGTDLFSFDPLQLNEITDDDERFAPKWLCSYGHVIPAWDRLLRLGYSGIRQEAEKKLEEETLTKEQRGFLECAVTACSAVNTFILRYAHEAKQQSQTENRGKRKKELLQIAAAGRKLSEGGASGFYEAVQLVWYTMLVLHTVCGARDYAYGRIDRYLYPYYEKDVREGRLSREEALEILECMFVKANEVIGLTWEAYRPKRVLSVNSIQYILLSGSDREGNDTTNEVSRLVLEAVQELQIKQPTVNVCYHPKIDRAFWMQACETAAQGLGYPSFFCDRRVREALLYNGVPEEDIYDYGYYGCNNSYLPGKEDELREAWHCAPLYLEYALNQGASLINGKVTGPATKNLTEMHSMEDIYEALRIQMRDGIRKAVEHVERSDAYWNRLKPFSFESVIMEDCIERAGSMNRNGSRQRHLTNHMVGFATTANSLYALNRLVFQEKRYTLEDFVHILEEDWEGNELLRKYIWERYPKYGNDEDEVDAIAAKLADIYVEEVKRQSPMPNGRKLYPSIYSLWHHRNFGKLCGATADGRKAGSELSESQSPVYGTETEGPTAMFNSVAKLPLNHTPSGGINVKFQPKLFEGGEGYRNLASLLETFFRKGGMHAQINVVSRETLEDAKRHPDQHRNLLVRVVGYSAYFVTLSPEQQQEIIERTEL